ncbi:MAG: LEA type 2 family protein [Chlorobiales bacterium]|nr:LEA type 2 family protein [Chlorobiales bacterium]
MRRLNSFGVFVLPFASLLLVALFQTGCQTTKQILNSMNVKEPGVSVSNVAIEKVSLVGVNFTFDVKIDNPNQVGVNLSGFDYDFLVNGHSFAKGDQEQPIKIEPKGSSTVQIPLMLGFTDLFSVFTSLKKQSQANYQLTTGFHFDLPVLGKVRVPAEKTGNFSL